jgi:hypothetical protein
VDLTGLDYGHPGPKRATTCQHVRNRSREISLADAGDATDTKAGSYVNGFTSGGDQGEAMGFASPVLSVRIYSHSILGKPIILDDE